VIKEFTDPLEGGAGVDGCLPFGPLALSGTTLYGATVYGGVSGAGVVFRVNSDGSGYTVLKQGDFEDGGHFLRGVILSGTTLYGTTPWGRAGAGAVFKLNIDGSGYRVLKWFGPDGRDPRSLALSGTTLYGATVNGGVSNAGVVFMLDTDGGHFTLLKRFNGPDGSNPGSLVVSGTTLYGTTGSGGSSNCGTVFGLSLPVPSIRTPPQSQTAETDATVQFSTRADKAQPLTYEWTFNGTNVLSLGSQAVLRLPQVQPAQAGAYTVVISNLFGAVTSSPALLSVIPRVERRIVAGVCLRGEPGSSVNLECTDALSFPPNWVPFAVVALANSPHFCFDLSQPLPPQRFFRAWHTGAHAVAPSLNFGLVPAVTVTGAIGSRVRVDGINAIGPIDAWVPLDTVTLTNASQLYFDVSAPRPLQRLYRLVPEP
jgi:uncharacterized repeat protein (TIGR03803 family)